MSKKSAEDYFASTIYTLMLDTQFSVNEIKREIAIFALIVWVAAVKRALRGFRKSGLVGAKDALSEAEAMIAFRFRSFEKRLMAQLEGIFAAQRLELMRAGASITVDAKFGKLKTIQLEKLALFGSTFHELITYYLANFRTRLFMVSQLELLQTANVPRLSFGESFEAAEELYEELGGSIPESPQDIKKFGNRAQELLPRGSPALRLGSQIDQTVGDFAYLGLITHLQQFFNSSSLIAGIGLRVIQDDRTSVICKEFKGGVWDVVSKRPLAESLVQDIDFPGWPPYHSNCRTTPFPVFHQGLKFKNGVSTTGEVSNLPVENLEELAEEIKQL